MSKNSLGGNGPVASFQGPFPGAGALISPKLGPVVPPLDDSSSQQSAIVAEDIALDDSPLNSARSGESASSMKSAFSTMHPASISGGTTLQSRRSSAAGERAHEFEDVFTGQDLESGMDVDREDASLLHPDTGRGSHAQADPDDLYENHPVLDRIGHDTQSGWTSSAMTRLGQATGSLRDKLRGKYAEYRESRL